MKILPSDSSYWYRDNGDLTLRINYPELNNASVVVDIGARHGAWSDQIRFKYGSKIYCFEVVDEFCNELKNKGYKVYKKAVYNRSGVIAIGVDDNEGSIYHDSNVFHVECIEAGDISQLIGESEIDLMKINVEGAEYGIIENLIDTGEIKKIKNLQVQFHIIEGFEDIYENLATRLKNTHDIIWRYPFVWENWKLKKLKKC